MEIKLDKTKVRMALNLIEKKKTKLDYIHGDGLVFGHILTSFKKTILSSFAEQLKSFLPGIRFRILKSKIKLKDKIIYDLYGDYYKFWEVYKPETKVIDIHKKNGKRPPFDIYIGRKVPYTEFKKDSPWANPFSYNQYGPECLEMFEDHLRNSPELLAKLPELKEKILGCWCKDQRDGRCHGDIIIKIMKERGII